MWRAPKYEALRIFVGYDSREPVAYHVFCHSLLARASRPICITPLVQSQLRAEGLYTRPRDPSESTEFSLTRFLVPYLCGFEGQAIFADCDMLARTDICSLLDDAMEAAVAGDCIKSVFVCKHDYTPKSDTKMDDRPQAIYPKKNWSSFMLFDNRRCEVLTPDYVNRVSPRELHQFHWLGAAPERHIGALPIVWNWLVGEYEQNPQAKVLHYTDGGPWFAQTRECDHRDDWQREFAQMSGQLHLSPLAPGN